MSCPGWTCGSGPSDSCGPGLSTCLRGMSGSLIIITKFVKAKVVVQFSAPKLPLNATVEMGGVNQVTHRVQSLVCRDVTLFSFLLKLRQNYDRH